MYIFTNFVGKNKLSNYKLDSPNINLLVHNICRMFTNEENRKFYIVLFFASLDLFIPSSYICTIRKRYGVICVVIKVMDKIIF